MNLRQSLITSTLRRAGRKALGPQSSGDGAAPNRDALAEMGFLEHLEALRWTIFKAAGGVLVTTVFAAFFKRWIIDTLLLGPARPDFFMYRLLRMETEVIAFQNRTIPGQFFVDWGTVLAVGMILGSPVVVYYIWKFIEPGLYRSEKRGLRFASMFATFFFILGLAFGYCIITPLALQFFANYQISPQVVNDFDITKYFSMITWWAFGAAILFELPVVVYFLASVGLLTEHLMIKYRRFALIGILILAALFTPPDPLSMFIVAIPLLGLYQLSIRIARYASRRHQAEIDALSQ